jgi:hypothetical protein
VGREPDLSTSGLFFNFLSTFQLPKCATIVGVIVSPYERRLLNIETARVRHAWAKDQITSGGTTPALLKYLQQSLAELAALKANHQKRPK